MSTREFPSWMYRYADSGDTRIPDLQAKVRELEAALLELNDENARLRDEIMEPAPAPVAVARGHVLLEIPVPDAQVGLVAARGTARLLMGHRYAQLLATELFRASETARMQRRQIEATGGNLPRTPEEDALLSGERP